MPAAPPCRSECMDCARSIGWSARETWAGSYEPPEMGRTVLDFDRRHKNPSWDATICVIAIGYDSDGMETCDWKLLRASSHVGRSRKETARTRLDTKSLLGLQLRHVEVDSRERVGLSTTPHAGE